MTLLNELKGLIKDEDIKNDKTDINIAIIATHDSDNAIGIIPIAGENGDLKIIDYLLQGFMEESEILCMEHSLLRVKQSNPQLYEKVMATIEECNYKHLDAIKAYLLEDEKNETEVM